MLPKEQIFTEIIDKNKDRIFRICCYYLSNQFDREDLYQEILIQIWKSLENFKHNSKFSTWIYRIAVNTSLTYIVKKKRSNKTTSFENVEYTQPDSSENKVEEKIALEENIKKLYSCINKLPVSDRTLISLYLSELKSYEIAKIIGLSESNVRVKIHRIKKQLSIWM